MLFRSYLDKKRNPEDPRYDVLTPINHEFPPCYIMTCEKDFIKSQNPYLLAALDKNKVPYVYEEYKSKEGNKLQHVFHCTVNEEHAIQANDDECDYFKNLLGK